MRVKFEGCYLGDVSVAGRTWTKGDEGEVPDDVGRGLVDGGWFSSPDYTPDGSEETAPADLSADDETESEAD